MNVRTLLQYTETCELQQAYIAYKAMKALQEFSQAEGISYEDAARTLVQLAKTDLKRRIQQNENED